MKKLRYILPLPLVFLGLALSTAQPQVNPNLEKAKLTLIQMLKNQLVPALESLKSQYSDPSIQKGIDRIIDKLNKLEPLTMDDLEVFKKIAEKEVESIPDDKLLDTAKSMIPQLEGIRNYAIQMLSMYNMTNNPVIQQLIGKVDKTIEELKEKVKSGNITKEDLINANYSLLTTLFGFLNGILLSISGKNVAAPVSTNATVYNSTIEQSSEVGMNETYIKNPTWENETPAENYTSNESLNATNMGESNTTIENMSNNINTINSQYNVSSQNNLVQTEMNNSSMNLNTTSLTIPKSQENLSIPSLQEVKEKLNALKVRLYLLVNKAIQEKRTIGYISPSTKQEIIEVIKQFLILKLEEYEAMLFNNVSDSEDKEILMALEVLSNNGNSILAEIDKVKQEIQSAKTIEELKKAFFDYVKLKTKLKTYLNTKQ